MQQGYLSLKKLALHHYLIEQLIMFFLAIKTLEKIGQVHLQKNPLIMFYQLQKKIKMNGLLLKQTLKRILKPCTD